MEQPADQLWRDLSTDLRGYFRRRVRDDALAEDLLQDTFVKIQKKIGDLRDDDRVAPWVYRVARSTLVDHVRRAQGDAPIGDVPEEPDDGDLNAVVAGWLRPMLASLPDEYREALELTELRGLSQKELADELGLSPSGARTRVQRARKRLRDTLDQCCRIDLDRRGNVIGYEPRNSCCD